MSGDALESLRLPVEYDSFLLRTRRSASGGQWRWMIENVMTGERHTFTELPELVLFLRNDAHGNENQRHPHQPPGHRHPARLKAASAIAPLNSTEE